MVNYQSHQLQHFLAMAGKSVCLQNSLLWGSGPQTVKNLPAMQETWVRALGWEDPLGKGKATHSRILAWRIPWTEEPGGLPSMGSKELNMTERLSTAYSWLGCHCAECLMKFSPEIQKTFREIFLLAEDRNETRNQLRQTLVARCRMGLWEFEIKEKTSKILDTLVGR